MFNPVDQKHMEPIEPIVKYICMSISTAFFKDFIFILFFRERGKEGQGEGEEHQCARETSFGCLSHAPNRGPGPQPRHVP